MEATKGNRYDMKPKDIELIEAMRKQIVRNIQYSCLGGLCNTLSGIPFDVDNEVLYAYLGHLRLLLKQRSYIEDYRWFDDGCGCYSLSQEKYRGGYFWEPGKTLPRVRWINKQTKLYINER